MNPRSVLLGLTVLLLATQLAACGGSSPTASAPGSPDNPLVARTTPDDDEPSGPPAQAGRAKHAAGATRGSADTATGDPSRKETGTTDGSTGRASRRSPCELVSRSEATAILGRSVQPPIEAPQGPTCIYRTDSGQQFITLSVQSVKFAKLRSNLRERHRIQVSGGPAYCGRYGSRCSTFCSPAAVS